MLRSRLITIPDEEVTWAGESPWYGRYCLGTESGKLLLVEDSGAQVKVLFEEVLAEEAINGVAFWSDFIGVSTRSEVVVYHRDRSDKLDLVCAGPGGAHGIVATATWPVPGANGDPWPFLRRPNFEQFSPNVD